MATELPGWLQDESIWSDDWLEHEGIPVVDVPLVTVGGGLGSLALVEFLRAAGVPASDLRILGVTDLPHETYKRLAENSQISDRDTLRSTSDGTMDNIWGWPGYALRQAVATRSLRPLWKVLAEPVFSEYFTPRSADVYPSVERESRRLSWQSMLVKGQVRMVRRRETGGYFVVQIVDGELVAYRCRFVHIAVGYPSLRFLPDLQAYRLEHGDASRVVNAYERHEYVYEALRAAPLTVLVRGSGIVASRVLQRLFDDRKRFGAQTRVLHLFRTYVDGPKGPRTFRRAGGEGFSYQPFNFPKAAFGGQFKEQVETMPPLRRPDLIRAMGGTSTPRRRHWLAQIEEAKRQGAYVQHVGEVAEVRPSADGKLATLVRRAGGETEDVTADFIVDATGLEGEIRDHVLLRDILDHTGAYPNSFDRLDVESTFELRGTRNGDGRIYASGSITLGGYFAPVDSFLGLQYAALQICDDLATLGFCARIGVLRSVRQWARWARNREP